MQPDPALSFGENQPARPRLLIVDDETELMTALCDALNVQGYEAAGFISGRDALQALQEGEYDLMLADLMMPGMDGITLLRTAQEIDPYLMGIIMTGQGTVQTAVEAMRNGAFDYLLKPFKLNAVLPVLSRALDMRRLRFENLQLRQTVAIYELSQTVAFTLDWEIILDKVTDAARNQTEADEASIMLPLPDREELVVAAVRGEERSSLLGERQPFGQGISGWVAAHREPLILQGKVDDPRFVAQNARSEIRSAISMPMLAGSELIGVLNVNSIRPHRAFSPGQVKALSILASTAAAALQAARLYEQVRRSEEQHRLVLENVDEIIYRFEADRDDPMRGAIRFISRRVENILGYEPEEFLRDSGLWFSLVHPDDAPVVERQTASILAGEESGTREYRMRCKENGEYRWMEDRITPQLDLEGERVWVFGVARDVTGRKQRERELAAIAAMSAALRGAITRSEMLPVILNQVLDLLNMRGAALAWRDPQNGDTITELGVGEWAPWSGLHLSAGEGISGRVIANGQPYLNNDVLSDSSFAYADLSAGLTCVACVPLIAQGEAIGVLWVGRVAEISPSDLRLVSTIGDVAANAIHRATLYDQAQQHLQRITALHTIDRAISASLDPRVTLSVLLEQVIGKLAVDAADVLLVNPFTLALEFAAGRGFLRTDIERSHIRIGEGYAGQAILTRRIVAIPDLPRVAGQFTRASLLAGEDFTAYYGVPLIAKGQVVGILEIFHRSSLNPNQAWMEFLEALASQAAIAIENAALFDNLQKSNFELALAYDTTLEGWTRALDLRDRETEGHTRRVTELTLQLARVMGVNEADLVHIHRGALLHDIGKVGIPDNILHKPGPLDEEEWEIMRKHPVYAYEMLSPIAYLKPALDIPYCHHEKWNGTGYPRGLEREEIPMPARIFAIVDVWDALRSDRPYRQAWEEQRVREYIHSLNGVHFDPQVVDVFLKEI